MSARLDPADLAARAAKALSSRFPGAEVVDVEQFVGGTSSLTYGANLRTGGATQRIVIKAAPPGLEPLRNRDVLRQARLLKLLGPVPEIAVPEILAEDVGAPVEVPPLFVMTFVPGESYEPLTPAPTPATTDEIRERSFAAARMAAALHRFPTDDPGLGGERITDLESEVGRWTRAFGTVEDDLRPGVDQINDRLLATAPKMMSPSVCHGDWRLGNMQCTGPRIDAVIDWEIWSLGDRRVDFAWYMLMMDPHRPGSVVPPECGAPSIAELIAAYEDMAGAKLDGFDWFAALVRYKQACASALIIKNNRKVPQPGVDIDNMVVNLPKLLDASRGYLT